MSRKTEKDFWFCRELSALKLWAHLVIKVDANLPTPISGGERPRAGEDQEDREDQSQDSAASGSHSTGLWLYPG